MSSKTDRSATRFGLGTVMRVLVATTFLGLTIPVLASCTIGGAEGDIKQAIGTTPKKLAILVDRLGPVIMSSQGMRNEVILNVLASANDDGKSALEARIERLLKDDAYAYAFAKNAIKAQWERYPGKDGTFLGQWGIPQNEETLDAFVRSQVKPAGETPSAEAKAWIRDNLIKVLEDRYGVDFTDPVIRDALGPELVPATPGLGS